MSGQNQDPRVEKARALYREGQCCSQAVVGGFLDEFEQSPLLRSLAAGLCGGMGERRADCGALTGAALCLGPLLDPLGQGPDGGVRVAAAELNRQFMEACYSRYHIAYDPAALESVLRHVESFPCVQIRRPRALRPPSVGR